MADAAEARKVLRELKIPERYDAESFDANLAKIHEATLPLEAEAAKMKLAELEALERSRGERRKVRAKIERLINARNYLFEMRGWRPGDVVAGPGAEQ